MKGEGDEHNCLPCISKIIEPAFLEVQGAELLGVDGCGGEVGVGSQQFEEAAPFIDHPLRQQIVPLIAQKGRQLLIVCVADVDTSPAGPQQQHHHQYPYGHSH